MPCTQRGRTLAKQVCNNVSVFDRGHTGDVFLLQEQGVHTHFRRNKQTVGIVRAMQEMRGVYFPNKHTIKCTLS